MSLILASASPRRAELLTAAGFAFEVCATDVDESVRPGEEPRAYVRRLAMEKSARAWETATASRTNERMADVFIIGADTAVIVDDEILGKPADEADAARMIHRLSGRAHVVMTGVSVRGRSVQKDAVEETRVYLAPLSAAQIEWYVGSGEGRDKAGGYAIQGLASRFIPRIEGSYTNVVGLPVSVVFLLVRAVEYGGRLLASDR